MRFILTLLLLAAPLSFAAVAPRSIELLTPPEQSDGRHVWAADSTFDASGNQYIVGQVRHLNPQSSPDHSTSNNGDLFVLKLSPTGQTLYAQSFATPTPAMGIAAAWGTTAAVGSDGTLFVAGMTNAADFPNPGDPRAPRQTGFVAAISPDGSEIVAGARIDGTPVKIAVGPNGEVYVAGDSESIEFPITAGTVPPSGPAAIYLSTDGGESWQDSSSGLVDRVFARPIFHPTQPQVVYLEQTIGFARSDDGGLTWTEKRVPAGEQPRFSPPWFRPNGVALDPRDPDVIFTGGPNGLFRSDDGASSWTKLPLENVWINDVVIDPDAPDTLYALGNDGLYKTVDAGQTWTLMQTAAGFRGALALDPSDSQTVYFAEGAPEGRLQRSDDGGATWNSIRAGLPENLIPDSLVVDPFDSDVVYLGSSHQGVFRSADAGETWAARGADSFNPIGGSRLIADPLVADRLWAGGQRSNDAGLTWEPAGGDLEFPLATSFGPDPSATGRVLAATVEGGQMANAFLMSFTQDLEVEYARIFGGIERDHILGLTVDSTGGAVITGWTQSQDFPLTNPLDADFGGTEEIFVAAVSPDGQTVDLSTFLGVGTSQIGYSVAVAPDGSIYVAGYTAGELVDGSSFESQDGYIAKIAADRRSLEAVLNVGGSSLDSLFEVAVTASGRPVVLGVTSSNDFRPSAFGGGCGPLDLANGAHFIAVLDADLTGVDSMLRYSAPPYLFREILGLNVDAATVEVAFNGVSRLALPGSPLEDREGWQRIAFDVTEDDSDMAVACALNGASFASGPVSPGQILTLQGVGLGPDELVAFSYEDGQSLPTELGGVRVLFDDEPAAIFHAWDAQTSVVVPSSVSGQTSVEVEMGGAKSAPILMGVSTASPGLFLIGGEGEALVDANWQFVNASNPVEPGDVVTAYLTGSGPFSAAVDVNAWAPVEAPFATVTGNVTATIGGVAADVVYIGQAPGLPNAVQQVNVLVPAGVSSAEPADFTLSSGGASTQAAPLYLAAP